MKTVLLGITLILVTNSCFITRTPGFYSGYNRLSIENRSKVKFAKTDAVDIEADSILIAINAKQLFNIIRKDTFKSIVYFWSPYCSATACISLKQFKNYCHKYGYKGIIISQYYGFEELKLQGIKPSEIYAINQKYYKSEYCNTYVKKFQNELLELFNKPKLTKYPQSYFFIEGSEVRHNGFKIMIEYPWNVLKKEILK
jgi:hypothetical protein